MAAVDVVNLALHALGEAKITSAGFTTPATDVEKIVADRYPVFIAAQFGSYPWHFAKRFESLVKRTAVITNITAASAAVLTVTSSTIALEIRTGDIIEITGVAGMTQINGRRGKVVSGGGTVTLTTDINSSAFSAYSAGGVAEVKPLVRWRNAFRLPTDLARGPRAVYPLTSPIDYDNVGVRPATDRSYDIESDLLYTDLDGVAIEYFREVTPETEWLDAFHQFIVKAFAADIAIDVTGNVSMHQALLQDAFGLPSEAGEGGLYKKAKSADSQRVPSEVVEHNPLSEARFGAGGDALRALGW
jgi:hypothetical protein